MYKKIRKKKKKYSVKADIQVMMTIMASYTHELVWLSHEQGTSMRTSKTVLINGCH